MNKKLRGFILALSIPLAAMANEGSQAEMTEKIEQLTKILDLNVEQQAKIKSIFEQKEQKRKLLFEEVHAQMQQVLTPGQRSTLAEKRSHQAEQDTDPKTQRCTRFDTKPI